MASPQGAYKFNCSRRDTWNKQHSNQGNACVRLQDCVWLEGFTFRKSRLKSDLGKVQLQKVQLGKKKLFTLLSMSSWGKGRRVGVLCFLLEENALIQLYSLVSVA